MNDIQHRFNDLSFRQRILFLKFMSLIPGDHVWLHITPKFQKMWEPSKRTLLGRVLAIPKVIPPYDVLDPNDPLIVTTEVGQFFFCADPLGISRSGQATLSVPSSRHGELLCLYEPEPILVKTAECGCGPNGPCATHRPQKEAIEQKEARRQLFSPHDLDVLSKDAIDYDRSLGLDR